MLKRQHMDSPGSSASYDARAFGLGTAAEVNAFMGRLGAVARPLHVSDDVHECVSWVGLLVFLCEVRQVLRDPCLGLAAVHRVLASPRHSWESRAACAQEELMRTGHYGRGCYLARLLSACLAD